MNDKQIEINQAVLQVVDDLLAKDYWQASLLLKTASKRIAELREQGRQLLERAAGADLTLTVNKIKTSLKENFEMVYISVYQTEGSNLQKWLHTLKLLADAIINRPVYSNEEDVRAMIRGKENQQREAYIAVFVHKDDILPNTRKVTDRLGHELITIKPDAVKPENIIEFVHGEKKYTLAEQSLVLKDNVR